MSAISFNNKLYPVGGAPSASMSVYDNSNTGLPTNVQEAIDKTTGNVSSLDTVELTATAAHAHAVGSTFLWIGQLVKATAAIAVGDTIALGTNVENTDICSVLDEVNSKIANYGKATLLFSSRQSGSNIIVPSLSQFRYIAFMLGWDFGNNIFNASSVTTIPMELFSDNTIRPQVDAYDGSTRRYCVLLYVSDTSVTISDVKNISGNWKTWAYGIK